MSGARRKLTIGGLVSARPAAAQVAAPGRLTGFVVVLGLLGLFYVLPPVYAALGRVYAGDLVASGRTDLVVLELPSRMVGHDLGQWLTALLVAGAFAAFLSTSWKVNRKWLSNP